MSLMENFAPCNYNPEQVVVHPLFDKPEEKLNPENLGPMHMTKSVKYSLISLRVYLILMVGLASYRVLFLAGVFGK
jgi:hypothetical protein